ncbi:tagaturonate reductase [Catalinimonas alkaloidigena]|uniref:Altronate oxidoreductase n=1 Tax=Catalinimonas alkaloidigena TaxID=1075417 RepID=A0A1G8WX56_9BACT|nr:tagaturonate reductase [Catalinimonas alkaloidigena]SDJ82978.1 tagaturonate reductase [Catalinimonas alkaloidigena]
MFPTDKTKRPERILQFGEGNFLRAFVDWIVQSMNDKTDFDGSVVVVQPIAQGMVDLLNQQDSRYTLYLQGIRQGQVVSEHQVIDSISRGLNPYTQWDAFLQTAEQPEMRFMVSNTTEAGIATDANDWSDQTPPTTFPAKLTCWLQRRYQTFGGAADKGIIFLPCELINYNGDKLKTAMLYYVDLWGLDEGFKAWIEAHCTFCNTLVDRIVPGFPRDRIQEIHEELGYKDQLVVEGEQFHLWVIEAPESVQNEFPADRAGLNVKFVRDMQPYRTRKVRILNGAHTTMVPVAYLYGLRTVRESVEHDVVGSYIHQAIFEEIIPTLDLPREELEEFANDVLERFRNPYIQHYLISIALNSTSKFETRVLPSLLTYQEQTGKLPQRLVFALAALIRFYKGDVDGESIDLKDDQDTLDLFGEIWKGWDGTDAGLRQLVEIVLGYEKIWKQNLNEVPGLTDAVAGYVKAIDEKGMKSALEEAAFAEVNSGS